MDQRHHYTDSLVAEKPAADECKSLKTTVATEDRPREKAMANGLPSLTNAELLAALIGTGTRGCSVVDLCQRIINLAENHIYNLVKMSVGDIRHFPGIGLVKAIQIGAALELAKRYQREPYVENEQIRSSEDAYHYLRSSMEALDHEEMRMLILSRSKRITGQVLISTGGTSSTVADIKLILRRALERQADGILLAHNHPSNNPTPSTADDNLTRRLAEGCKAVDIELVDHLVVCRQDYYSYVDHGKL